MVHSNLPAVSAGWGRRCPSRSRPPTRRAYTHFCRCGKTIDAQLESSGGTRLAPRSDVNREDYPAVDAWIDGVISALPSLSLLTVDELQAAGMPERGEEGGGEKDSGTGSAWARELVMSRACRH